MKGYKLTDGRGATFTREDVLPPRGHWTSTKPKCARPCICSSDVWHLSTKLSKIFSVWNPCALEERYRCARLLWEAEGWGWCKSRFHKVGFRRIRLTRFIGIVTEGMLIRARLLATKFEDKPYEKTLGILIRKHRKRLSQKTIGRLMKVVRKRK